MQMEDSFKIKSRMAYSVDSDETAHYLDLHCLRRHHFWSASQAVNRIDNMCLHFLVKQYLISELYVCHYENMPIQIYRRFHLQKLKKFQIKPPIFFIFLLKT